MVVLLILMAVIGLLLGLATGGSLRAFGERTVTAAPLLVIGLLGHAVPMFADGVDQPLVLAAASGCLLAFCASNLRFVGMPIVLLGLALNLVPLVLNNGIPVDAVALVNADRFSEDEVVTALQEAAAEGKDVDLDLGPFRRLERDDDRLPELGDTIPIAPLESVVSWGDLIVLAGVANVLLRMTRAREFRLDTPLDAETIFFEGTAQIEPI